MFHIAIQLTIMVIFLLIKSQGEKKMDNNNFNNENSNNGYFNNFNNNNSNNDNYNSDPYNPYNNTQLEEPVSFKEWMITILIMLIPVVNIVMFFVWAFGGSAKKSKSNFFKAMLIYLAIAIIIEIIAVIAMGTAAFSYGYNSLL